MASPEDRDFVGFDGRKLMGSPQDYQDGAIDSRGGIHRFETYFRTEGYWHAEELARELMMAPLLYGDVDLIDYSEAIRSFGPAKGSAQQCYAAGLCNHLAYSADVLRGIIALRDLRVPAHYDLSFVAASDLPSGLCLVIANKLTALAQQLSHQAGIPLPWRLQHTAAASTVTSTETASAAPSDRAANTDRLGQSSPAPTAERRGTAAKRHGNTTSPRRDRVGRSQ